MKLLTNEEIEKSIQHLAQIKQAMRDGKVAKSEKDTQNGLPKLVFTERTTDELLQAMLEIKHYKSKVEEMQKTLDKAILEIRIWSNCYGDEASKQVAQKVVEELRQTLKGESL